METVQQMEYGRIANGIRPYRRWCTVAICLFCHLYMLLATTQTTEIVEDVVLVVTVVMK